MVNPYYYPASPQREAPTDVCVSFWYLPGGYDCVNAEPRELYFAETEDAERFCRQYESSPEMAVIVPRSVNEEN